jgi:adenylate kinase family enzyme
VVTRDACLDSSDLISSISSFIETYKPVLFISGIAGSGKTNKSEWLGKLFGLAFFDMSVQLVAKGFVPTPGVFANIQLVRDIVKTLILNNPNGMILSGFPRNRGQATLIGDMLQKTGRPFIVIDLNISEKLAFQRISKRGSNDPSRYMPDDQIQQKVEQYEMYIEQAIMELSRFSTYPSIMLDTSGDKDEVNSDFLRKLYAAVIQPVSV